MDKERGLQQIVKTVEETKRWPNIFGHMQREETPEFNISGLRDLAIEFGKDPSVGIDLFFKLALYPYYDCLWKGVNVNCGHFIYRLSDHLPKEKREIITIHSSESGSIITEFGLVDSLEDWRHIWEKEHKEIPTFQKEIEGFNLVKQISASKNI
jgi:hypothetical protein